MSPQRKKSFYPQIFADERRFRKREENDLVPKLHLGTRQKQSPMQKNWTIPQFLMLAFLPVIALELCLLPFWFAHKAPTGIWLPTTQLFLTGLFLPIYLSMVGCRFIWIKGWKYAPFTLATTALAIFLAVFLDYFAWGASTCMFWHPDIETVILMIIVIKGALAVSMVPLAIAAFIRYVRSNSH